MRSTARILGYVWLGASLLLASAFGYLYYEFYWRWRELFNSEGRYYDAGSYVVYHAQSGAVYLGLLMLSVASAVCAALLLRKLSAATGTATGRQR